MNTKGEVISLNKIIEQAKHELEQMIDTLPEAMLLTDSKGNILRVNKTFIQLIGKRRFQDVVGKSIREALIFDKNDAYLDLLENLRERKEMSLRAKVNGKDKDLQFVIMPAGNNAEWRVIFVEDEEEKKKHLEKFEQECKREAAKAIICTLMHNINQPLTVTLITAQLLKMNLEKQMSVEEMRRNIDIIVKNTMQVGGIIKSLENPESFITEKYIGSTEMFDIRASFMAGLKRNITSGTGADILSRLMEVHVPGYLAHAERTAMVSEFLAQKMGLKERDCSTAMSCGYYHDIGKIGIPDVLLQKPSKLTQQEVIIMQNHCEIGKEFLSQFPFMEDEAESAWCHHEMPDGKGYPRGLKEKDIPIFARIVAVADCFEVMTAGRPYESPKNIEETLTEMHKEAGTQFSSSVFAVLEQNVDELQLILQKK